jgi:hypothetical protein
MHMLKYLLLAAVVGAAALAGAQGPARALSLPASVLFEASPPALPDRRVEHIAPQPAYYYRRPYHRRYYPRPYYRPRPYYAPRYYAPRPYAPRYYAPRPYY